MTQKVVIAITSPSYPNGLGALVIEVTRGLFRARLKLLAARVTLVSSPAYTPLEALRGLPLYQIEPPEADRMLMVIRTIPHPREWQSLDVIAQHVISALCASGFFAFRVE